MTSAPLRLFLLRHAKSDWGDEGLPDEQRPLAARGLRTAPVIGEHLARQPVRPDVVLCSSALRARQTMELVIAELPEPPELVVDPDLYLANSRELLARLQEVRTDVACVLLIGHNPSIQELAESFAGGREATGGDYPTAALTTIELRVPRWAELSPETAEVVAFVTPRQLS